MTFFTSLILPLKTPPCPLLHSNLFSREAMNSFDEEDNQWHQWTPIGLPPLGPNFYLLIIERREIRQGRTLFQESLRGNGLSTVAHRNLHKLRKALHFWQSGKNEFSVSVDNIIAFCSITFQIFSFV